MLNIWASQQQGGIPTPPDPLAIWDVKNSIFSINGVAKTLHDLFVADNVNWLPWPNDDAVIPGTGIVYNQFGAIGLLASAALLAALPHNFVCVADYSKLGPDGHFSITATADFTFAPEWQWDDDLGNTDPRGTSFIGAFADDGPVLEPFSIIPLIPGGAKIAMLFSDNTLNFSINGGPAFSSTSTVVNTGVLGFYLGTGFDSGATGGATLRSLKFYPAVAPRVLSMLSA